MSKEFSIWTVYEHPLDYPDYYVARRFEYDGGTAPTDEILRSLSLDALRDELADMGLTCIQRNPEDEPHIVECWI
jgi:hypothetical protein